MWMWVRVRGPSASGREQCVDPVCRRRQRPDIRINGDGEAGARTRDSGLEILAPEGWSNGVRVSKARTVLSIRTLSTCARR